MHGPPVGGRDASAAAAAVPVSLRSSPFRSDNRFRSQMWKPRIPGKEHKKRAFVAMMMTMVMDRWVVAVGLVHGPGHFVAKLPVVVQHETQDDERVMRPN